MFLWRTDENYPSVIIKFPDVSRMFLVFLDKTRGYIKKEDKIFMDVIPVKTVIQFPKIACSQIRHCQIF